MLLTFWPKKSVHLSTVNGLAGFPFLFSDKNVLAPLQDPPAVSDRTLRLFTVVSQSTKLKLVILMTIVQRPIIVRRFIFINID